MSDFSLSQIQSTSQLQVQRLSQVQIQTLNLLSLSSEDLRAEIYKAAEENPALEIVSDLKSLPPPSQGKFRADGGTRVSTHAKNGEEKSENFQLMLEAEPDERETLHEHLIFQLDVMRISKIEYAVGRKLIDNLDERGWHILSPFSLFPDAASEENKILPKMIEIIQRFDPVGVCCVNIEESLFVQARIKDDAPLLALFLLDGNLKMLDQLNVQRIQKKLVAYRENLETLRFANAAQKTRAASYRLDDDDITHEKITEALEFIRTLNPRPAEHFVSGMTHFVRPDVYVTKESGHAEKDDDEKGIVVCDEESYYKVRLSANAVPLVRVAKDFAAADKTGEGISAAVAKANAFVDSLSYRVSAIMRASCELVRVQKKFFEDGPGNLAPLTRHKMAEKMSVHESTVSRLADSKYLQCAWGLFPMKYFFTSAVATENNDTVSRDAVLAQMRKILDSQPENAKKLSDQKLADELAAKGIKIARRTVAKYRSLLEIGSSYDR